MKKILLILSILVITTSFSFFWGCDYAVIQCEYSKISGSVKDSVTNQPISGCKVEVFKGNDLVVTVFTIQNGNYEVGVPVDNSYKAVFSKTGYITVIYENINVTNNQNSILDTVLLVAVSHLGNSKIIGSVKDAVTIQPISGCRVEVYKGNNIAGTVFTIQNGNYEVTVPVYNGYKAVFSKTGYITAIYENINVINNQNSILETVLLVPVGHSGNGNIAGKITNALTGQGVSGLALKLRSGINVTTGTVLKTTNTVTGGTYAFTSVPAGNYTIEASGTGYITMYFSVVSIGGLTTGNQNATITPILSSGQYRIILTWGISPLDLDAHFTGPLPSGGRFHMYYPYSNGNGGSPWPTIVTLDVDDVSSYGPETTTLHQQITGGLYRFSVHDYTNRNLNNSYALSNSGAQVKVYKGSVLLVTYNIPQNVGGTLWRVFELQDNTLTPLNTFSYVSDPSSIDGMMEGVSGYHKDNKK